MHCDQFRKECKNILIRALVRMWKYNSYNSIIHILILLVIAYAGVYLYRVIYNILTKHFKHYSVFTDKTKTEK